MYKKLLFSLFFFQALIGFSQEEILGDWHGVLNVQGMQLRIVFHIEAAEEGLVSTLDSPDQKAFGIAVASTVLEGDTLKLSIPTIGGAYEGVLGEGQTVAGTFSQGGMALPLDLSREEAAAQVLNRPQEPKAPFPYYTEEVTIPNVEAGLTLAGTLSLPTKDGQYPVVVLISGSGPQNRDEELLGHKPFLVLADFLTRNGIGVLRYDDRGTAKSTGNFAAATSADFVTDVQAALAYLRTRKEADPNQLGLIGHSEGGLIAPMVAAKDPELDFIVLLAGPGISGYDILMAQTQLINRADGMSEAEVQKQAEILKGSLDLINAGTDLEQIKEDLGTYLKAAITADPSLLPEGLTEAQLIDRTTKTLVTPWFQYFLKYDPKTSLSRVQCPVLAINGEKDLQVPSKVNLEAIGKYLEAAGNKEVTLKELPNLNHLFQESTTGAPSEYAEIEETFSPKALNLVLDWIKEQTD